MKKLNKTTADVKASSREEAEHKQSFPGVLTLNEKTDEAEAH